MNSGEKRWPQIVHMLRQCEASGGMTSPELAYLLGVSRDAVRAAMCHRHSALEEVGCRALPAHVLAHFKLSPSAKRRYKVYRMRSPHPTGEEVMQQRAFLIRQLQRGVENAPLSTLYQLYNTLQAAGTGVNRKAHT